MYFDVAFISKKLRPSFQLVPPFCLLDAQSEHLLLWSSSIRRFKLFQWVLFSAASSFNCCLRRSAGSAWWFDETTTNFGPVGRSPDGNLPICTSTISPSLTSPSASPHLATTMGFFTAFTAGLGLGACVARGGLPFVLEHGLQSKSMFTCCNICFTR